MTDSNSPYPAPDDVFFVNNLDTLKVLADRLRMRVLALLGHDSLTVKEMAKRLSLTPTKLYYHVNLLEEHGLIRVVDTRIVSGIIEKRYQTSARSIRTSAGLLSPTSPTGSEGLNIALSGMLDETKEDIIESVQSGVLDLSENAEKHQSLFSTIDLVSLTKEQALELREKLWKLVEEYSHINDGKGTLSENTQAYALLTMFYPSQRHLTHNTHITYDDEEPEG
ncbi:MAG: helix-turn-helix domain-containing protein [Burkholderiales bacterium]|nr:helix-turn-helix domain-containing protein [Anaerolineae bacterium]